MASIERHTMQLTLSGHIHLQLYHKAKQIIGTHYPDICVNLGLACNKPLVNNYTHIRWHQINWSAIETFCYTFWLCDSFTMLFFPQVIQGNWSTIVIRASGSVVTVSFANKLTTKETSHLKLLPMTIYSYYFDSLFMLFHCYVTNYSVKTQWINGSPDNNLHTERQSWLDGHRLKYVMGLSHGACWHIFRK